MNSRCPIVPIIANPFGLDRVIVNFQQALQSETWLTHIYGLVRFGKNDKRQDVPMIYLGKKDYDILNLNDAAVSICYFQLKDDQNVIAEGGNVPIFRYDLSLVVLANLQLIDNTANFDYHFEQLLIARVIDRLQLAEKIDIKSVVSQRLESVLDRWSKEVIPETWWLYPFTGFRINFSLTLPFDCVAGSVIFQQINC